MKWIHFVWYIIIPQKEKKRAKKKKKKEVNFLDHHNKAIVKSQVGSQETLIKGNIQSFSIRTSTKKKLAQAVYDSWMNHYSETGTTTTTTTSLQGRKYQNRIHQQLGLAENERSDCRQWNSDGW